MNLVIVLHVKVLEIVVHKNWTRVEKTKKVMLKSEIKRFLHKL